MLGTRNRARLGALGASSPTPRPPASAGDFLSARRRKAAGLRAERIRPHSRWSPMKDELLALTRYAAFVGVLAICLGGGLLWLLAPDPSLKVEPRPPLIPQKILDSIERKKSVPVPVSPTADAVKPVMVDVPVALSPALPRKLETTRELRSTRPKAKRQASPTRPGLSPPAATRVVTTGRTDFPY